MRKVAIVGGGATLCGRREASWKDLVQEAGKAMFESVENLSPKEVDSLIVGAAQPERFTFQVHVAPMVAEYLGITPRKVIAKTELICASDIKVVKNSPHFDVTNFKLGRKNKWVHSPDW